MKEKDLPRNEWKLGRIVSTSESKDGLVRKVELAAGAGQHTYERPIHNLVLLVPSSS